MIDLPKANKEFIKYVKEFDDTNWKIKEKQYHTFNDLKSFDHGDYGAELLKKLIRNFISIDKYDKVIFEAVRNHNKLRIDENLNEQERLFAKLVRDADKLDIMDETINLFYKETRDLVNESDISEYTLNFVRNHQPVITPKDVEISRLDGVVRKIANEYVDEKLKDS